LAIYYKYDGLAPVSYNYLYFSKRGRNSSWPLLTWSW